MISVENDTFLAKMEHNPESGRGNLEISSSPVPQMAARHGGAHCSAFRHWKCPQLGQGREHIMLLPLPKLWALPTAEVGAMGTAVFFQCDSRPLFDTFCLGKPVGFSIRQKMEQNPTYNWADLIHFQDESRDSPPIQSPI